MGATSEMFSNIFIDKDVVVFQDKDGETVKRSIYSDDTGNYFLYNGERIDFDVVIKSRS